MDSDNFNSQDTGLDGVEVRGSAQGSWLRVGAVAAVSALAGGLAAAWFYRKTLTRLHSAESTEMDSNFRTGDDIEDEI